MRLPLVTSTIIALSSLNAAYADTFNVPADFPFIQTAIDVAQSGDNILVEAGTYVERIDFLGKAITITSVSGSSNTILDGSAAGSVVSFISGEALNSVLDGFTIRSGSSLHGGGVTISNSSAVIQNCLITGNQATLSGGGMYVDVGSVQLENVVFEGNDSGGAGGAIYLKESGASITGVNIISNAATNGGGLYIKDSVSTVEISGVTFRENDVTGSGGGIFVKNSELIVENCVFDLNSSNDGGAWFSYAGGDATVTNSTFTSNSASGLGGAANVRSNSTVSFIQCTFDSNVADSDCDAVGGGAILNIANSLVTLDEPTICNNVLCDTEDMFYGDSPIILGDIFDCTVTDGPGACCGGSACWVMEEVDCIEGGGAWNGAGSACADVLCDGGGGDTTGACCVTGSCVHATEASCVDAGGVFYGTSATCETTTCQSSCAEDVNGDGMVDVNDLLSLIAAWGMCP